MSRLHKSAPGVGGSAKFASALCPLIARYAALEPTPLAGLLAEAAKSPASTKANAALIVRSIAEAARISSAEAPLDRASAITLVERLLEACAGSLAAIPWLSPTSRAPVAQCQFIADFGAMIDLYGSLACEGGSGGFWRRALLVLLDAEERIVVPGVGGERRSRVLTPFSAWAVTIAHTFSFPAAVAHHVKAPALSVDPRATGTTLSHYCRYFYFLGLIAADYGRNEEACALFEAAAEVREALGEPFACAASLALTVLSPAARGEAAPQLSPLSTDALLSLEREAVLLRPGKSAIPLTPAELRAIARKRTAEAHVANLKVAEAFASQYLRGLRIDAKAAVEPLRAIAPSLGALRVVADRSAQQLLDLTKVYTSLPLAEAAAAVGLSADAARQGIDRLVAAGRIGAVVDDNGVVRFSDVAMLSRGDVEEAISRAVDLAEALEASHTQLVACPSYARSTRDFKETVERERALAAVRQ